MNRLLPCKIILIVVATINNARAQSSIQHNNPLQETNVPHNLWPVVIIVLISLLLLTYLLTKAIDKRTNKH